MARELDALLSRTMQQYTEDVRAQIKTALTDIGKQAIEKLKADSPRRTGKYAKGWRMKTKDTGTEFSVTVYQSGDRAFLTHILENGHRKRGKQGTVHGRQHILPVEEWAQDAVQKAVEKAVSGR